MRVSLRVWRCAVAPFDVGAREAVECSEAEGGVLHEDGVGGESASSDGLSAGHGHGVWTLQLGHWTQERRSGAKGVREGEGEGGGGAAEGEVGGRGSGEEDEEGPSMSSDCRSGMTSARMALVSANFLALPVTKTTEGAGEGEAEAEVEVEVEEAGEGAAAELI